MSRIDRAAEILIAAHRAGQQVPDLPPEAAIESFEEAIAVQQILTPALGPVAGWKVAARQGVEGAIEFAPIPAPRVEAAPTTYSLAGRSQVYLEVEIALVLTEALAPIGRPRHDEEVAAVSRYHVAIEIISSRLAPDFRTLPKLHRLADGGGTGALVIGDVLPPEVIAARDAIHAALAIAGGERIEKTGIGYDPLALTTALANLVNGRGETMAVGQAITTGSICLLPASPGALTATINGHEARVTLTVG